ncbi:cadmium, cobalt and zinc/H(+)-K(+) antiporter CzcD [Gottschalkia acidurici 9a]|uniref:Cadmium, cobalt and zinc/H(+)-K(+) antiporter CzcD n=1 Tax=Gottschalkia acidurici (strain ATCC 7906 / DSM 604 / BCRC 14475 / CIP 104303 / KCTC 5404 / NCIMB 10678 / 9a) TaxID=1128398 RepID=K0B2E9_GOTA9|nr:cation diffusion facilitator family transporter [Gottschalkia acidurici]AFS79674.1 cadmium, cobalt and zinc/H(+)-K(+) antiporter CzcD [Gottschalkia acidurici 9a]
MKKNSSVDLKNSEKKILQSMMFVLIVFMFKLVGGIFANSLALLSDSLHLITDFIALIISWIGLKMTSRAASHKYTFGYYRHSILTALINNILLIAISVFILYKAVVRYLNPVPVESTLMIFFSVLGVIVNTLILLILKENNDNINVQSAFLHFVGDIIGDISVLIGATVIYFTGFNMIDTFLSAILSILILRSAIKMSYECIKIFLESAPSDISINEVCREIKSVSKVICVRDIHLWSLSKEVKAMTALVSIDEKDIKASEEIIHEIQHLLKEKFNIVHSTIQIESSPCSSCFHSKPDHRGKCNLCIDSLMKEYDESEDKDNN